MISDATGQAEFFLNNHPALARSMSSLGLAATFPPDIPEQAAQARGKDINATIGQITDGRGHALALPAVEAALKGVEKKDRALLYSPIQGNAELRDSWRAWQRRFVAEDLPSTLPMVTVGLSHSLSLLADVFSEAGTPLVVPTPFWGNYRQMFGLRRGAILSGGSAYNTDGGFDPSAWQTALDQLPGDQPAVTIVNFPSNPGGYFPNHDERQAFLDSLLQAANRRPLVAIFDDAYAGLVYQDDCDPKSLFWDAVAANHPNLIPIKVDGGTKEFGLFGGRVGFITFGYEPDSEVAAILESKLKCLSRALLGSPVAIAQEILLQVLQSADVAADIEKIRVTLSERYRRLRPVLDGLDRAVLRPLACNAGCFALVEIPEQLGLTSEQVRLHLLDVESVGVVSIAPRFLRIAFCSMHQDDIERTVESMERAVRDLSSAS